MSKPTITAAERRELCRQTVERIRQHCDELLASNADIEAVMFGAAVEGSDDILAAGVGREHTWRLLIGGQVLSWQSTAHVDEVET